MAEVDYGYGEQLDYGYGDAEPDMIAEEKAVPFYSGPDADMMYGNENDAAVSNGQMESEQSIVKRVKRRCSVTKFTLESGAPSTLTAASVIANMRNADISNETTINTADGCTIGSSEVEVVQDMALGESGMQCENVAEGKKRGSMLRIFSLKRN